MLLDENVKIVHIPILKGFQMNYMLKLLDHSVLLM